jgi:hypothetical protein
VFSLLVVAVLRIDSRGFDGPAGIGCRSTTKNLDASEGGGADE